MIDIHSHILYGIDDGAKSIEEALVMLKEAELSGITDIILTPHFVNNGPYTADNESKQVIFNVLQTSAIKNKIKVNLYIGNEVYFDSEINNLLDTKAIKTLNDTKYLLIELPKHGQINSVREIIFELMVKGIIPIIAHPERCETFQRNKLFLTELSEQGVLFQGNIGSLFGSYGTTANKELLKLIKQKKIHFLASDVHHPNNIYQDYPRMQKKLKKILKDDYELLLEKNPLKVLVNKEI